MKRSETMEKFVKRVEDNQDKCNTYKKYCDQYKLALRHEFYLEAIMIDYAMMEDRLLSLLSHLGVITIANNKLTVSKFCRSSLREFLGLKPNGAIRLDQISTKRNILKLFLNLSEEQIQELPNETLRLYYVRVQNALYAYGGKFPLSQLLDDIDAWCNKRNQYVHALFNKNYIALQEGLEDYVKTGMSLAEGVHGIVQFVKPSTAKNPRTRVYNIRKEFRIK